MCSTLWFYFSSTPGHAQQMALAPARADASVTMAVLHLSGQTLLEQPDAHLSHPKVSPDGRYLAVTVTPLGVETDHLAQTYLFDAVAGAQLALLPGYSPTWDAQSRTLRIEDAQGVLLYDLRTSRLTRTDDRVGDPEAGVVSLPPGLTAEGILYPQTIRVAHHPSNGCREGAEWQVEVIPFEEYVARVVPAETPATWPLHALAAQAVAARTYAWRQILVGRATYDVTDWANFQMMCDKRYPNSDAAVQMTAGQYLTVAGETAGLPISAMYSAENGHPTLTNPNVPYLQAVPDLLALGKERYGHGYGLSQWGAYRRAIAGYNYMQILAHYYTDVYLENGLADQPLTAALVGFDRDTPLGNDGLRLRTLGPLGVQNRFVLSASSGLTTTEVYTGTTLVWRAPQPLAHNTVITVQLWIDNLLQDTASFQMDYTPPTTPAANLPTAITQPLVQLEAPMDVDQEPALRANWQWEGEDLWHTSNSGALTGDPLAANGAAWQARVGQNLAGVWYGPYITALPAGFRYRALFYLRVNRSTPEPVEGVERLTRQWLPATPVARLDVADDEGRIVLGLRDLWLSDFGDDDHYSPIAVDFYAFAPVRGLEFRVNWPGLVDLAMDRVEVWRMADLDAETPGVFTWSFSGQSGVQNLALAAFDRAGHVSEVTTHTIQLVDNTPPQISQLFAPAAWLASNSITLTATLTDSFSGLALDKTALHLESDQFTTTLPVSPTAAVDSWLPQPVQIKVHDLPDGVYAARLQAVDKAGNRAEVTAPLLLDLTAPSIRANVDNAPADLWHLSPVSVTLVGQDQISGIHSLAYRLNAGPALTYTALISLTTGGIHRLTYWAADNAGNLSAPQTITVNLDLAAPVVTITQYTIARDLARIQIDASDDGMGVTTVEVQSRTVDGATEENWQDLATNPTGVDSESADLAVNPDQPTRVRARATDGAGRVSAWVEVELWVATGWVYLPVAGR